MLSAYFVSTSVVMRTNVNYSNELCHRAIEEPTRRSGQQGPNVKQICRIHLQIIFVVVKVMYLRPSSVVVQSRTKSFRKLV